MARGISWMLLALFKEGPRLMRAERRDTSYAQLLQNLRDGFAVELTSEEYAKLRAGWMGRQNVQQLILCFFSYNAMDRSLVLVWREHGSTECFARLLNQNERRFAIQNFGLRSESAPPAPRHHYGVCRLEDLWAEEWFALPDGNTGWVQEEQEHPLGDGVEVVLGFYDSFPTLDRRTVVYILSVETEARMLVRRWAPQQLVTLDDAEKIPPRPGRQRLAAVLASVSPAPSADFFLDLLTGDELLLPVEVDEDLVRERLFITGRPVEIPCSVYTRLTTQSQRIYRDAKTTVHRDEEGHAHAFWRRGSRCFTRMLSSSEAGELTDRLPLSA